MDMVVCTDNPSTREVGVGVFKAQGHPQLHREFEASLGDMKLGWKNNYKGTDRDGCVVTENSGMAFGRSDSDR